MSRPSLPTPCPAFGSRRLSKIPTSFDIPDDTATTIEYTRAFDSSLRGAKPRRSSALYGKMAKRAAPIAVFEEVKEDQVLEHFETKQPVHGKTLLSKPARRVAAAARDQRACGEEASSRGGLREMGQGRSQTAELKGEPSFPVVERKFAEGSMATSRRTSLANGNIEGGVKKEPRRRTIFVPEDTTVMTIHPGANTTRLDDTFQLPSFDVPPIQHEDAPPGDEEFQLKKPLRRPRRSLAAAPRRAPLQPLLGFDNMEAIDVCGANTGKENQPPMAKPELRYTITTKPGSPVANIKATQSRLLAPTAASQARQSNMPRNTVPLARGLGAKPTQQTSNSRLSIAPRTATPPKTQPAASRKVYNFTKPRSSNSPLQRSSPHGSVTKSTEGSEKQELRQLMAKKRSEMQASKVKQYAPLTEDLAHLSLYEDDWLSHQEVALTEVVNEIFSAAYHKPSNSSKPLRQAMIEIYHQPDVAIMHKRLQASLVYGALSKPKGTSTVSDLRHDIGLRKCFVNLWLESYSEEVLRAAAEVVVGKQIPRRSSASQYSIESSEKILDPVVGRRDLIAFLETFFVHVSDLDLVESLGHGEAQSLETMRWRKTMERSFMLIWLLDQANTSELVAATLFKNSSTHKSSASVLRTLSGMLLPAVGDIIRTVKQFDYELSHTQDPLDEVVYHIENLAVDLRDGILLTHLVETLLYTRQASPTAASDDHNTVTITLPDAAVLQSDCYTPDNFRNTRMLSQHLKMPCLGHAQKAFNVQVALSALECYDIHAANVVGEITADDIVNGHREKTLSLLWSLVSVYGLDHLIDWKELLVDTEHTIGHSTSMTTTEAGRTRDDQASLLQDWATAHYPMIKNLTTSFSDGKVYSAILENFAAYLPSTSSKKRASAGTTTVEAHLTSLGCSAAFTRQLAGTIGVIPSRETTLSNLAFLASRLLPLSKQHHAATRIQRWFLHKRMPTVISQRVALMRMARDCALVVLTQQKITGAATTLQRAWRKVIAKRIEKLESDVAAFQVWARGWKVRKMQQGGGSGRVMGGW